MILKFLLTAFLGTSFLGAESFASEEERLSLSLTGKQLKTGYELTVDGGFLELDDGSKWSVTNAYEWGTPSFEMFSYLFDETYGSSRTFEAYDWQKIGVFNFVYNEGMPLLRWNPETQQMEEDPNGPGFFEVFNLNVKRLVESSKNDNEKEIVINNKNTVIIPNINETWGIDRTLYRINPRDFTHKKPNFHFDWVYLF